MLKFIKNLFKSLFKKENKLEKTKLEAAEAQKSKDLAKSANWILGEFLRLQKEKSHLTAQHLVDLILFLENQTLSMPQAKQLCEYASESGESIEILMQRHQMKQESDPQKIASIIEDVILKHPQQLEQFRSGKEKFFVFFVGQTMKALAGQGNPRLIHDLLLEKLKKSE